MKRQQRIFLNKLLAVMLAVLMALPMNTIAWAAEFSDGTEVTSQDVDPFSDGGTAEEVDVFTNQTQENIPSEEVSDNTEVSVESETDAQVEGQGDGWEWVTEGEVTYLDIKDGKITKGALYDAFVALFGAEPVSGGSLVKWGGDFRYANEDHSEGWSGSAGWLNVSPEIKSTSTGDAEVKAGENYAARRTERSSYEVKRFTVRHYYSVTASLADGSPEDAAVNVDKTGKIYAGESVNLTITPVNGYWVRILDGTNEVVRLTGDETTYAYTATASKSFTVEYVADTKPTYEVILNVVGKEYGEASLNVSEAQFEGAEISLTATPNSDGYIAGIEISGAEISLSEFNENRGKTGTFIVGDEAIKVTVTFAQKVLNVNETIGTVGFNTKKTVAEQLDTLKQNIFNAVINVTSSLPSSLTYDMLTYQYKPLGKVLGERYATEELTYESKLYYSFGGQGLNKTEVVVLTWAGNEQYPTVSVEATITLVEGRQEATITYEQPTNVVEFETEQEIIDAVLAAADTNSSNIIKIERVTATLPDAAAGETTLTYKLSVEEDENYLGSEKEVSIKVKAKSNPATINITIVGNGTVQVGELTASGTLTKGTYDIVATPNSTGNTYSKNYVSKITVNGEDITDNKLTVENDNVYDITVEFAYTELTLNQNQTIYVNQYLGADRISGLKEKILKAVVEEYEEDSESYQVKVKGLLVEYDLDTLNDIEKGMVSGYLEGTSISVIIKDKNTGLYDTVTLNIADSRSTVSIEAEDVTIEAKSEDALEETVEDQVKAAIHITATNPETNEATTVDVLESKISYNPSYSWPADGETATFTVKVTVSDNETYAGTAEKTLTLTIKDTTELYTVTYTDGTEDAKYFQDQVYEKVPEDTAIPSYKVTDAEGNETEGVPSTEYYDFGGWKLSDETKDNINENGTINGNLVYIAQWTPKEDANENGIADQEELYTVVYAAGYEDGEGNAVILGTYDNLEYGAETPIFDNDEETEGVQNPTRDGYNFLGWNPTVAETIAAPNEKDSTTITYTAQWTEEWVVSFVGHTYKETVTVNDGEKVQEPEDAWDDDHDFLGWFADGAEEAFDFNAEITDNIHLTAKWVEDYNHNDVDDATEEHYTVTYVVDDKETKYENILTGMPTPVYGEEDPTKENCIFAGWEPEVAETVTAETVYTAKWLNDANKNGIDDEKETVIIKVVKADDNDKISLTGAVKTSEKAEDETNNVTYTYVYDSTEESANITLVATPVTAGIEDIDFSGITYKSTTYVDSVCAADEAISGTYGDKYVYTCEFAPENGQTVTVTFKEAGFDLNDPREMNYYAGMTGITNEAVYEAIASNPKYADATAYTIQYKARGAMTQTVDLTQLTSNDELKAILRAVKVDTIDLNLPELWLDVNVETDGLVKDSVSLDAAIGMYLTPEKISGLWDIYNAAANENGGWLLGMSAGYAAVKAELEDIYENIYAAAMYYGAHNFGYNATDAETVTEEIKITYKNDAMYIETETDITLRDMRAASYVVGSNVSLKYKDYTDEELAEAIGAYVTDVNGNKIEGASVTSLEITDPYTVEGRDVSDTAYEVTFKFAGNDTYKPSEKTFTVTIQKASVEMNLPNVNVTYGTAYSVEPELTFGNKYGKDADITESMIQFLVGLDVSDLSVGESGVSGINSKVQLFLPKEMQDMLNSLIGGIGGSVEDGVEISLSKLVEYLSYINNDSLDILKQMLEAIQGITDLSDFTIVIGGSYPTNIGTYLYGAVSTNGNYETAYDVGYIVITPNTTQVYLDWNFKDSNGVFTHELLQYADFGASAFDDKALTAKNVDVTEKIQSLIFGLDAEGKLVLKWNETSGLTNGVYTQLAFVAEFGNNVYYAVPIVRAFTIIPNAVNVTIVDNEGTNFKRTFDEQPQSVDVELTYTQGTAITPDAKYLKVTYSGVQTDGTVYNSEEAPTHAGVYVITAVYVQKDDAGTIRAVGMDAKPMMIMPAEVDVTVESAVIPYDGVERKFSDYITVETSFDADPDTTVISAGIVSTGDFSENGWKAVEGNVNIDFPAWMDELLKDSEIFTNGVNAKELSELLNSYEEKILAKIEALDLKESQTEALISAVEKTLNNLVSVLEQMPENVTLTFNDDAAFSSVGAYAVVAIVTDTDYMPAMDAGVIVVIPDVEATKLKWNHEDENGIWTRELLDKFDLKATAYNKDTDEVDAEATEKITYQFVGFDAEGNLIVTDDASKLPNGVYTEMAYIKLEVGGKITISDMITRIVTIIPSVTTVQFVDENGTVNPDRSFAFDNTEKAMTVKVSIDGNEITPAEGALTVTYYGVQTNGQTYNSTTAPKYAGVYAVTAEYKEYAGDVLKYYGAAAGAMVIKPVESSIEVTDKEVPYDKNGHTLDITAKSSTTDTITPDYTVISGIVNAEDNEELGANAYEGTVNIDFPEWLDKILEDSDLKLDTVTVTPGVLKDFMKEHMEDIFAMIPTEVLKKAGMTDEEIEAVVENIRAVYNQIVALLEKMPNSISVTFEDEITYAEPGTYLYYGIVTDKNHIPSMDKGVLEIVEYEFNIVSSTRPEEQKDYRDNLYKDYYQDDKKVVLVKLNRDDYNVDDNEYPVIVDPAGEYIFSGWFDSTECDTAYTEESGEAWAKFVDANVLTTKIQTNAKIDYSDESIKVRFITTVDSFKYQKVGFEFQLEGFDKKCIESQTVYKQLMGLDSDKVLTEYNPTIFSKDSIRFFAVNMSMNQEDYAKTLTLAPYWITKDGTKVIGKVSKITYNEIIKMIQDYYNPSK